MDGKVFKVKVLHGPNLNLLGHREPEIYGTLTLTQINEALHDAAQSLNVQLSVFQSNHEGALVDEIQHSAAFDGVLINPAAYTHTSVAIRDALLAVGLPFVEVHLSDVDNRESFRKHSYLSDVAVAVCKGKKEQSYTEGLQKLVEHLKNEV